ncbi:unnamed protein product, partial [Urochloa humidicola]
RRRWWWRRQHRRRGDLPCAKINFGIPTPSLPLPPSASPAPQTRRRPALVGETAERMRVRPAEGGDRPTGDVVGNAVMSSTVLGDGSHGALPSAATAPTAQSKVRRSLRQAVPATEVSVSQCGY